MKISVFGKSFGAVFCLASTLWAIQSGATTPRFLLLGTAAATGIYYPAGNAICRSVNKTRQLTGLRCSAQTSPGSSANLSRIANGQLDLLLAQADTQYHAYHGSQGFSAAGANKSLRSVFSLHTEAFTIVVRSDANIDHFDQLLGKRVNIGNPGSGHRQTMQVLMAAKGWQNNDFAALTELTTAQQVDALCENKIDAFVYLVGHPTVTLKQAANSCDVKILGVDDALVEQLVTQHNYYLRTHIAGGTYRSHKHDVNTLGVAASVIASKQTSEETVYQVVKSVFENLDGIRAMHPAFAELNKATMATTINIPLHPGARRYYREIGLL